MEPSLLARSRISPNCSGVCKQGLGRDGGVELLPSADGVPPKLAGGNLHVLGLDGRLHIAGRELVAVELVRIEPDAHGVLGAENQDFADAFDPADDILDVGDHIIGQIVSGSCCRLPKQGR